jgi:hypothetical protein
MILLVELSGWTDFWAGQKILGGLAICIFTSASSPVSGWRSLVLDDEGCLGFLKNRQRNKNEPRLLQSAQWIGRVSRQHGPSWLGAPQFCQEASD